MLKYCIILLIGLALISPAVAEEYIPPADAVLLAWWDSMTLDEQAFEIRKWDIIEHTVPSIEIGQFGALVDQDGNLHIWSIEPITMTISHLKYEIKLRDIVVTEFEEPEPDLLGYILIPLITTGTGIISTAIGGGSEIYQYIISGGIGLACGILIDIYLR